LVVGVGVGVGADVGVRGARALGELGLEYAHPLEQGGVGCGEDAYVEQAGVACVGDRDGGDGTPTRIWAIDSRESRPSSWRKGTGTPMTGREVAAASMPGRRAPPPAPAIMTRKPQAASMGAVGVGEHVVWGAAGCGAETTPTS
jgi:hypothetical protein